MLINEHAAENAILHITRTPEEAQQIVAYLTTLDWEQTFLDAQEGERRAIQWEIEDIAKKIEGGGGYCGNCGHLFTRLYAWPHASHELIGWSPMTMEEMLATPIEDLEKLHRLRNTPPWDAIYTWCYEWYCRNCLWKQQETMQTPWNSRMDICDICGRLIRMDRGYRITQQRPSVNYPLTCCVHCVEKVVERQFAICKICGKKTMNGHVYEVCYDCKVYTPSVKALSSHLKRAMDASTPATLTPKEWIATLAYFGGKCAYCMHRPIQVLEHFLPIALGGGTTADNCVPACHRCNIKKRGIHPDKLSPNDFSTEILEHIRQYLSGDKQETNLYIVNDRALMLWSPLQDEPLESVA